MCSSAALPVRTHTHTASSSLSARLLTCLWKGVHESDGRIGERVGRKRGTAGRLEKEMAVEIMHADSSRV